MMWRPVVLWSALLLVTLLVLLSPLNVQGQQGRGGGGGGGGGFGDDSSSGGGGRRRFRPYTSPNAPGGGVDLNPHFASSAPGEACTGSKGACQDNLGLVNRGLPVRLGQGANGFSVSSSTLAQQVFQLKVAPGTCNPVAQLLVQLLTAKLNIAAGAPDSSRPETSVALAQADAWLGTNNWLSEDFGDFSVDIRAWTRRLHNFNLATGTGKGRCGPSLPCDGDPCEEQAALDERLGMFPLPALPNGGAGTRTNSITVGALWMDPSSISAAFAGPWVTRNMPQIDVSKLGYSARDWERFDGYDYQEFAQKDQVQSLDALNTAFSALDAASAPGGAGTTTSAGSAVGAKFVKDFNGQFHGMFRGTFFGSAYFYFRMWSVSTCCVCCASADRTMSRLLLMLFCCCAWYLVPRGAACT
jgi:hypothetical protein